ncbi:MAG TPA: hypothetical protein VD886_10740 [Herpetosiphonaceae bacterium]|nr:hypothetical protein [Herpetosiphonaceae bacterium]
MRRIVQMLLCACVAALGLVQARPLQAEQGGRPAKLQAERPSAPAGNVRSGSPQAGPEFFVVCDQALPAQTWTAPTAGAATTLHSCQFHVGGAALAYVLVTGSFGLNANAVASQYEANVEVLLDGIAVDSMNRFANVYSQASSNDGLDASFASSALLALAPGVHTVAVQASYRGAGPLKLSAGHFGLVAFSSTSAQLQACGSSDGFGVWMGSPTFAAVRSCAVTAPANGTVLIGADASVLGTAANQELLLRVGVDNVAGDEASERRILMTGAEPNTSPGGDGDMDANAAIMASLPINAGTHTIYLSGKTTSPAPPIMRSTLSALVIPQGSPVQTCANALNPLATLETNPKDLIVCSLTASGAKRALIAGNLNPHYASGGAPGEIRSRLVINGLVPAASPRTAEIMPNFNAGAWKDARVLVSATGATLPAGPVDIRFQGANVTHPASGAQAPKTSLFALIVPDLYVNRAYIPAIIR